MYRHYWRTYSPGLERLQRIFLFLVAIFMLTSALFINNWHKSTAFGLFESVFGLYLLLAPTVITPYRVRRHYLRTRGKEGPIIVTITDESIQIDCPGRSVGTVEWQAILGVLDRPTCTLLYLSPGNFLIFPRRVLTDAMHDELLTLCKSKGIPFTYPKLAKKLRTQPA
jgi:hypothetical protein